MLAFMGFLLCISVHWNARMTGHFINLFVYKNADSCDIMIKSKGRDGVWNEEAVLYFG